MRHRGDRGTSSAVQRVDFDGSALINFFVGRASHRTATVQVGTGSCRQCAGGSYRRSASALRRWVISTVCVGIASVDRIDGLCRHCVGTASAVRRVDGLRRLCVASRRVASTYIRADDRLTSAAKRFVDFSGRAAVQQRSSS